MVPTTELASTYYSILGTATASSALPQHPRHSQSSLSTATASSAPLQHPRHHHSILILHQHPRCHLCPQLPVPSSGWEIQGTPPVFPSAPTLSYFIYPLILQTTRILRASQHNAWITCQPLPPLPWKRVPKLPGWGAAPAVPPQRLPHTVLAGNNNQCREVLRGGCGMLGAPMHRPSSRERCHGWSIPRLPPPLTHSAQTSKSSWKMGSLLHFDRGCQGRALPMSHPEGKEETEGSYRPAQVEEDGAAPALPRRLSPPAPSLAGDEGDGSG